MFRSINTDDSGGIDYTEPRFKLLSNHDLLMLKPLQWAIKPILPASGIGAIYGASGSGKSFLVLDMAQKLATASSWFGYAVKRRVNVIYCALEGEAGISGRVKAYQSKNGTTSDSVQYLLESFDLRKVDDTSELIEAVKAQDFSGGLLVLDTLNRAAPGSDENSSKDMSEIISATKRIQSELGGMVLLVHHTGKDSNRGLRGHSSLHAALDVAIEVKRNGDQRSWSIAKSKDGLDGQEHCFSLDTVEIGQDEDGEMMTSCVIGELETLEIVKPKTKLSAQDDAILTSLGRAIAEHGITPPNEIKEGFSGFDGLFNQHHKVVNIEHWREFAFKAVVTDSDTYNAKYKAFKRGLDRLRNNKFICIHDDYVWRIY